MKMKINKLLENIRETNDSLLLEAIYLLLDGAKEKANRVLAEYILITSSTTYEWAAHKERIYVEKFDFIQYNNGDITITGDIWYHDEYRESIRVQL